MSFESGVFGSGVQISKSTSGINLANTSKNSSEATLLPDLLQFFPQEEDVQCVDDKNWSWASLRATFKTYGLGDLYQRYVRRLQNAYFNVYLLLQVVISIFHTGAILIVNKDDVDVAFPEIIVNIITSFTCLTVFCLICDEKLFRSSGKAQLLISIFIVLLKVVCDLSLSVYFYMVADIVRIGSAFQIIIVIYFFLPLEGKYYAETLGILVSIIYVVIYGAYLYSNAHDRLQRIVADTIFYLCGNCVGIYSLFMNEIAVRRAFLDRREYIKSTIKKDYETAQEEQLLLSILPQHVSVQVKQELMQIFHEIEESKSTKSQRCCTGGTTEQPRYGSTLMHRKPFSQLFVERHNNVSILFADIVNFTPLTVTLSAEDLVETLNQLFGQFDEAAKRHNCLRIKLLGDCYYCISSSSFPFTTDSTNEMDHAKNCVLLGLEMIEIIKGVREQLQVNVQMRIGIHSGNVISGLLGIYKWQYDIWSKDVTIANHMEQAGKPGKIHITRQTKDILGNEFDYQPVTVRDKYLTDNKIETFFIVPKDNLKREDDSDTDWSSLQGSIYAKSRCRDMQCNGRISPRLSVARLRSTVKRSRLFMLEKRPTDVTGENIGILIKMLGQVDDQMKDAIDKMPLRKIDQWCGRQNQDVHFNALLMNFASWENEKKYQSLPDPLFKFYIACALQVLICIGIIQGVVLPKDHKILWIAFALSGSFLLIMIPFVWVSYVWNRIKDPHQEMDSIPLPKNPIIRYFYKSSERISKSWLCRTGVYLIVAVILSVFAIIDVIECDNESLAVRILNQECQHPWYFTYSCTLAILGIYGFFRIHFITKFLLCSLSLGAYASTMFFFRADVFDGVNVDDGSSPAIPPVYAHLIYMIKIIMLLHIMDRQMEYINRLDFIWKLKLTEEHKLASITHATNAILIHNILPVQIAKRYMDPTRIGQCYSSSYFDVAVMFASIPNFMDFYTETDLNDQGIKCLQLLNEIIVDFDNALFEFEDVEKIKVIGSTYMAACGLEVNERGRMSSTRFTSGELGLHYVSNRSQSLDLEPDLEKRKKCVVTLVKFAAAMMVRLKALNKDAFQDFELRVGIDCGPIVAGVIGAQKPLYDIWGDTVNMASRMDSTSLSGKIQVAAKSANLLMQAGVKCIYRDRIRVKGKDKLIPTYFVKLTDDCDIQLGKSQLSIFHSSSDTETSLDNT